MTADADYAPLFIALVVAVIGPSILALITGWLRHHDRQEDWERQDMVAARAEQVAVRAAEAADLLLDANARQEQIAKAAIGKLDIIHTLVNSSMTSAIASELDATRRELALMGELLDIRKANGQEPSEAALGAVQATEAKISELEASLVERQAAQGLADLQQDEQNGKAGL